jgi:glutathione reductase (NADPH)
MLEEEAHEQGLGFDIIHGDSAGWSEYRRIGQQCAGFKLLIDKDTRQLLGAHVLGDAAEETINLFALAMRKKVDVDELRSMLWAYPSFGYAMKYMFR